MKPEVIKLKQALIEGGVVYGNPWMLYPEKPQAKYEHNKSGIYHHTQWYKETGGYKDPMKWHEGAVKKWREGMLPFEDQEKIRDVFWAHEAAGLLKDGLYSVDLDVTVVEQTRRKDLVPCAIWQDGTTQIKLPNYEYRKVLRIN